MRAAFYEFVITSVGTRGGGGRGVLLPPLEGRVWLLTGTSDLLGVTVK